MGAAVLDLPPLPAVAAGELIRALVGDALPDEVVAAVAERFAQEFGVVFARRVQFR